jgi:ANTAR domain
MVQGGDAVADSDVPDLAYERVTAQLRTMPVIEQAKGIVMAREGCGPEEAFDLLRRVSALQRTGQGTGSSYRRHDGRRFSRRARSEPPCQPR